jgi:predicted RNA-binding protein with PUA-like domain
MAYWLFKSEPEAWSWDDQVKKGAAGEEWTGVRNHTAKQNMVAMKKGDLGFFYHSVDEKSVVGIVRVIAEAHPDSKDTTGIWRCVDVEAVSPMPKPVSLAAIKAEPRLANSALVKYSRLSVQPVTEEEWRIICEMGGMKKAPVTGAKAASTKAAAPKPAPAKAAATKPASASAARTPASTKPATKAPTKAAKKTK